MTDSVQKQGQFAAIRIELLIYVMDVPRQMKVSGGFTSMETPLAGISCLHDLRKPGAAAFYPVLNEDGGAVCTLMNPVFSEKLNSILFTTNTERIVKFSLDTHQAEWVSPKGVFGASSPDHAISYPYPQNAAFLTSNHGLQVQCGLLRHRFVMDGKVVEESIGVGSFGNLHGSKHPLKAHVRSRLNQRKIFLSVIIKPRVNRYSVLHDEISFTVESQ